MARDVEVEVDVPVQSTGAADARRGWDGLTDSVRRNADQFRKTLQVFNDIRRLGGAAFQAVSRAVTDLVTSAVKFRAVGDPMVAELKGMQRGVELLKARIGDALLPVLQGLGRALAPVIKQVTEWVVENRALIGVRVTEWVATIANSMASVLIPVTQKVIGAFKVMKTAVAFLDVKNVFDKSEMSAYVAQWARLGAELVHDEKAASALSKTIVDLTDKFVKQAIAAAKASTAGGSSTTEEQAARIKGRLEAQAKAEERLHALREDHFNDRHRWALEIDQSQQRDAERTKAIADRAKEDNDALVKTVHDSLIGAYQASGDAAGAAFALMATGAMKTGEAMQQLGIAMASSIIDAATTSVTAYAASAGAAAAFSQAGIPLLGPFLAVAAAGLVGSFVKGLLSQIPRAQYGLINQPGAQRGRDSVMARVEPGEAVVPLPQMARDRSSGVADYDGRSGGRGGGLVINVNQSVPIGEADQARMIRRSLAPALARLGLVGA